MAEDPMTPLVEPLANPDPDSIKVATWVAGENPIVEVLNCVYPTMDSEEKRRDVIEYMQKLFKCSLGVEVFPYGSVPLMTYLPDGDIDLTAIGPPDKANITPNEVLGALQAEELFGNNESDVNEILFIDAEVKLVKCIAGGIVVDISFNQLGGLCTLCFLEKVDRFIGNDHIFKRSIILIKTWCYYESRIVGANYGLISTYGLEVLVLYIFNVFGASITSPLMALYRFLDYYGKFDWDNYCISLNGPVNISSLPKIIVENPINQGTGAFISADFMQSCLDMYTLSSRETDGHTFVGKHLNIIDPLKETNNLGRSVPLGNFLRIRSAFRYAACTLGKVLEAPIENIGDGIKNFFKNTLQRHQPKNILEVPLLTFDSLSSSSFEADYEDDVDSKFSDADDLDDYISEKDYVSNVWSSEASDLDAFHDLSLGPTDEEADDGGDDDDGDDDDVSDGFLFDLKNADVSSGNSETESLNSFADLTGDYASSLRGLLYGQCYYNLALNGSLVEVNPAPYSAHGVPFEVAICLPTNQHFVVARYEPIPHGQTSTRVGQHIQMETRTMARGTAPYIPNTSYLHRRNWTGWLAPITSPPTRGGSGSWAGAPRRPVYSQRKLEFGTFGPLLAAGSSSGSPGAASSYVTCGFSQGSTQVENLYLKSEEEFPPLAA